jgi:serine palmitoyltransferase
VTAHRNEQRTIQGAAECGGAEQPRAHPGTLENEKLLKRAFDLRSLLYVQACLTIDSSECCLSPPIPPPCTIQSRSGHAGPPLVKPGETFYVRRLYHRIQDCWNRPISSVPGAHIDVVLRESKDGQKTFAMTDKTQRCINLGSYNYLGFADDWDSTCGEKVREALETYGVGSSGSSPWDAGSTVLHKKLERMMADFLDKEDSIVFNMGYGTNETGIPALCRPGTLVVSDELNHTSIVNGCRVSGAQTVVFKHNDPEDLEKQLRKMISQGYVSEPGAHSRPWDKIIVVVEGIYSMEGEVCELRKIVNVAKAHRCYIYVDEAHSIGALGRTGRGVCEHTGVDPSEIDILMGTFTKVSVSLVCGWLLAD